MKESIVGSLSKNMKDMIQVLQYDLEDYYDRYKEVWLYRTIRREG